MTIDLTRVEPEGNGYDDVQACRNVKHDKPQAVLSLLTDQDDTL
jgi:hypothetical protein